MPAAARYLITGGGGMSVQGPTDMDSLADVVVRGSIGDVLPRLVV